MLDKEFEYYKDHQKELVKKYNHKVLVIKDQKVQNALGSLEEAYLWAKDHFTLGTFLLQECGPGEDNYTQHFNSRVIFA